MKIVADENVDIPVFEYLKDAGFNIEHVTNLSKGSSDLDVLNLACRKKALLLTVDKDSVNLLFEIKGPLME